MVGMYASLQYRIVPLQQRVGDVEHACVGRAVGGLVPSVDAPGAYVLVAGPRALRAVPRVAVEVLGWRDSDKHGRDRAFVRVDWVVWGKCPACLVSDICVPHTR